VPIFGKGKAITGKHECVSKSKLSKSRDLFASFHAKIQDHEYTDRNKSTKQHRRVQNLSHPNSEGESAGKGNVVELVPAILKLKSILVPIDFSKISQKALEYAVPIAKHFGARITLLHAIEPPPYSVDLTYVPMGEGFPIRPMKKELDALAKNTIEPQLLKEVIVRVGMAFEVITNVARDCKADLIVITTHGHTGLKHVFMGSTAERVVRHAPCPVFVVRKCEHQFI